MTGIKMQSATPPYWTVSHGTSGQVRSTQGQLLVAGGALAISVVLVCFSTGNGLTLWAAVASLLVSLYWGGRYVLLTWKLRSQRAVKKHKPDAQGDKKPDAADPVAS